MKQRFRLKEVVGRLFNVEISVELFKNITTFGNVSSSVCVGDNPIVDFLPVGCWKIV